jgi:hypothetical protein
MATLTARGTEGLIELRFEIDPMAVLVHPVRTAPYELEAPSGDRPGGATAGCRRGFARGDEARERRTSQRLALRLSGLVHRP